MNDVADPQCVQQAARLCSQLGSLGPFVIMAAAAGVAALFERWNRYRVERKAEAKLAEQAVAAAAALAKVKDERNKHAARAQALEVKIASIRPPPPDATTGGES